MKRALDVLASLAGLLLGWPLMLAAMVAIRLESAGSPLFLQARVGQRGRVFTCLKLRTMYLGTANLPTHEMGGAAVTPVGAWLRRTKLDEMPQLYNVLLGQMSLVGPRPCLPTQSALIEARRRLGVLALPPGITGLAQVQGVDMSDPERLAAIDAEYLARRSFVGDLRLILATVTGSGRGVDHVAGGKPPG